MANIFKDTKFKALLSIGLTIIIVTIYIIVIVHERNLAPYNTSNVYIVNRWASEEDFIVDGNTLLSSNPRIVLRPKYNIENLSITIRYINSSGNVIYSTQTQVLGNVNAGGEYKINISLSDMGTLVFSDVEETRIDVLSGTVFRLQRKVIYV